MQFYETDNYLLINAGLIAFKKNIILYFSSVQNNVTTINPMLLMMSVKRAKIGSYEFLTPFTNKCAKYLLLSKNKFKVCWGDNLKFFDIEITKNYKIFDESLNYFFWTSFISTFSGFGPSEPVPA